MKKKVLPINEFPYLISYTHNTYISSILSSNAVGGELAAKYKIKDRERDYQVISHQCETIIGDEISVLAATDYENGFSAVYSECMEDDCFILKVEHRRMMCAWECICIFLDDDILKGSSDGGNFLVKFGCPSSQPLFVQRNQKFLTMEDEKRLFGSSYFLKVERHGLVLIFSYSYDGRKWKLFYEDKLPTKYKLAPLAIGALVEPRNDYRNWLSCNYIQLYLMSYGSGELMLDYYTGPHKHYKSYYTNQFLDFIYEYYDYELLTFKKVRDLICAKILEDTYIITELDHYYIPKTDSYLKRHYFHEVMIYGMDTQRKVFNIMGYGGQNTVFVFELGFNIVWKAFNSNQVRFIFGRIDLNNNEYWVDRDIIKKHLTDYLNGYNCQNDYSNLVPKGQVQGVAVWGINILEHLVNNEEELFIFCYNTRLSYVLYEHKKIMLDRVLYLVSSGQLNRTISEQVVKLLQENVSLSLIIKNSILMNAISKNRKATMHKVSNYLKKIADNESVAYKQLCEIL